MGLVSHALLVALVLAASPARPPETAADAVTLRDGKVVLGQVIEPAPRGSLMLLVRRAWAVSELPQWAARWEAAEAASLGRAKARRRERLAAWRRERSASVKPDDPILSWIVAELARLDDPAGSPPSTLLQVKLSRSDVRTVVRRPRDTARMLRQAWLAGFANPETLPLDDLEDSLEGRGFAPDGRGTVSIDGLLPISAETDAQWAARRAATEVANDPGLKFVRTGPILLPEPEPGQPLEMAGAMSALGDLKQMLEGQASDPLAQKLGEIAVRGRVGAVVTQHEISPDITAVRVESAFWVRSGGRWLPATVRRATVRVDQLAADAGRPLADDPQVKGAFSLIESLGLGQIPDDVKRRSLNVGAATQKALGQVRSELLTELNALALPVRENPEPQPQRKP